MSPYLLREIKLLFFFVAHNECTCIIFLTVATKLRLTFTGLLARLEAVPSRAHAGPGCWRGGQTELRAVTVVVTAQVDPR